MRTFFLAFTIILFNTDTCVNVQKDEQLKGLVELALSSKGSPKRYWVADLNLENYQEADTLTFFGDKNYTAHIQQQSGRCRFICWEFLENQLVNGFEYHICEEPPVAKFLAKNNMTYQLLSKNRIKVELDGEVLVYQLVDAERVTISETIKDVFKIRLVRV